MKSRLWPLILGLVVLSIGYSSSVWAQDAEPTDDETSAPIEEPDTAPGELSRENDEPRLGPGGVELRTDYPGTEESLQARMAAQAVDGTDMNQSITRPEDVYDMRVRELETRVDDLKEKVFRSKSRIVLLKETVLTGNLAGSRAVVQYENRLGGSYKLRRALLSLDGARILNRVDRNNDLSRERDIEAYNASIQPGLHTVSVMLSFQGSGYGLFSYTEGYEFSIRSSCQFAAEEGKTTILKIVSYAKGNVFTAHEERPDILCEVQQVDLSVAELDEL